MATARGGLAEPRPDLPWGAARLGIGACRRALRADIARTGGLARGRKRDADSLPVVCEITAEGLSRRTNGSGASRTPRSSAAERAHSVGEGCARLLEQWRP